MNLEEAINKSALLTGTFTLRSGQTANTYFDKYRFESDPMLLKEISSNMVPLIPKETEILAGLEMGGIPIVTMLSQLTGLPAVFVRKQSKEYGTCKYLEGIDVNDKNVLIIEDVVTSGGAIIQAVKKMREDGISVNTALCVIDRESGGETALASQGTTLVSLLKFNQIISREINELK